jgi:lantibiotic modifying enzyme
MNPEYLEIADRIGARLCRDALWSGGKCNWTADCKEGDAIVHGSLGPRIYSGTSGIALFLWRLAEATGDRIIRRTALAALSQALSKMPQPRMPQPGMPQPGMPQPGCGLYSGGLGILFAASEIRGDWDEDAVVRQAALEPSTLDLIGGSAGCIAVLLHLHRQRGGSRLLETAIGHGDLLLSQAVRTGDGWSWKTTGSPRNLTGFSHGAAGIGWALLELWSATGESRFRTGALEAFRYERSCFNPERRNWPDFRGATPSYPVLWCHGAAGIGFSRLRAWQLLGDAELLAEARTALSTVSDPNSSCRSFSLCHGTAGNADLLIYAAQVLGEEHWLTAAEAAGRQGASRYERRHLPWPCGSPDCNETPDLMLGLAGIGYFYLRLADPMRTSTVLLPGGSGDFPGEKCETR